MRESTGGIIMKKTIWNKALHVVEKAGRGMAVKGGGDPTLWGFYEKEIPDAVKKEIQKKRNKSEEC